MPNKTNKKNPHKARKERMVNLMFLRGHYKTNNGKQQKSQEKKNTEVVNSVLLNIYFAVIWSIICSI